MKTRNIKPSTPRKPNPKGPLLNIAERLFIESKEDAKRAKDMLTRISFNHFQSPASDKDEGALLFLIWMLLDSVDSAL